MSTVYSCSQQGCYLIPFVSVCAASAEMSNLCVQAGLTSLAQSVLILRDQAA